MVLKTCSECKNEKCETEFSKRTRESGIIYISNKCKMCLNNYNKSYVTKNKEARKETSKRYYENNKDKIQLYKKEYDEKNKESLKIKSAQRSQKNKEHRNAKLKERRKNDLEFRIMGNLRTRVRSALNSKLKEEPAVFP